MQTKRTPKPATITFADIQLDEVFEYHGDPYLKITGQMAFGFVDEQRHVFQQKWEVFKVKVNYLSYDAFSE